MINFDKLGHFAIFVGDRKTSLSVFKILLYRRGGRVVEGARLESVYSVTRNRGFESLPLRRSL